MTARTLSWTSPIGRWLVSHLYTAVGFVVLVSLSVPFLTRNDSEWEYVYVQAAHQLRNGLDIYEPEIANSYPPFATLTVPFAAHGSSTFQYCSAARCARTTTMLWSSRVETGRP